MATAAVDTWQKTARVVQQCCNQPTGTSQAAKAFHHAQQLVEHLEQQPTPPKAAWKKLVQQLKVPLQLGTAFSTAAQHGWNSPATRTAVSALLALLQAAEEAELGARSLLSCSIQQQLQQAGVVPQLAAVMTAAAADTRRHAAALAAAGGSGGAALNIKHYTDRKNEAGTPGQRLLGLVLLHVQMLLLHGSQPAPDPAWLCDPCGHTLAGLQLCWVAQEYVGSVLQHVLPAVKDRAPQRAEALLEEQRLLAFWAHTLNLATLEALGKALTRQQQQRQKNEVDQLQKLLLSPHVLPCLAASLVVAAADISTAVLQAGSDRKGGTRSSKHSSSRSRDATRQHQTQAAAAAADADGNTSCEAPAACQLQLLQLLGRPAQVALEVPCTQQPELDAFVGSVHRMLLALEACMHYQDALLQRALGPSATAQQHGGEQQEHWRQQPEPQVWLLLPAVLLPCTTTLLSARVQDPTMRAEAIMCVQQLLWVSRQSVLVFGHLQGVHSAAHDVLLPAAQWQEVLGALLLLAGQLQQMNLKPAEAQAAEGAAPASAQRARGNSISSRGGCSSSDGAGTVLLTAMAAPECALALATLALNFYHLLSSVVMRSLAPLSSSRGASQRTPVSERWVEVGAACDAALRMATAAAQACGMLIGFDADGVEGLGSEQVLLLGGDTRQASLTPLARHMGLCGPEAFARELMQSYSLQSSLLRVCNCQGVLGQPCWGPEVAGCCCCWTAGRAAMELLEAVLAADAACEAAPTCWDRHQAAAAAQQPAVDYLPSLVIFGRCCLFWAKQLQQHASELLLLAAGEMEQEQQRKGLLHAHSAACVCIPSLRQGAAAAGDAGLESMIATASKWLADPKSTAAHAQLAAAGCSPQQLQQQLEALLAAQQGTQQQQPGGLTDVSLAALVHRLQATGAMLSSAVPHFCNHAACANISGPTEAGLVSRRSCLCSGCRVARYCGRQCQRQAWAQHKPVCKALQAAAAAAAVLPDS